jgi:hypothetical protein
VKAALAALILLALCGAAQGEAPRESAKPLSGEACGPLRLRNQVQMARLAGDNRDVVPFTINGVEKHFLFDTGGSLTQISETAARALNLIVQPGNIELTDVRGHTSRSMAAIAQFQLGLQGGAHGIFPATPNLDAAHPDPFDGILALDYLQNFDVEMDFGNDLLKTFYADHCPGHVLYWRGPVAIIPFTVENRQIYVSVLLDGHEVKGLIDSGTAQTSLRNDIARAQYGLTLGAADTPADGVLNGDAGLKTYSHAFGELSFGDIAVRHPKITIIPNVAGTTSDKWRQTRKLFQVDIPSAPQLIIGMDVLRRLRLYMAFGESKLYVSPASTPMTNQAKADP